MKRKLFHDLLNKKILVLDGSYGISFMKAGFTDIPGEILNLKNPEFVINLHKEYINAGADIILTNTFNANKLKLNELGYSEEFKKINEEAVNIAKKAANENTLIFGDISSTGKFPKPFGEIDIDDLIIVYKEQAEILYNAGVDGFIIETMSDIKELKAAIYGIRLVSEDIPLIAHMTFDESARSVTGTSVEIFASAISDLDIDVIGVNCSLGPKEILPIFEILSKNTNKYLSIEPNAGKPIFDGVNLSYNISPQDFGLYIEDFIDLGANIIGGCCGTTSEHIRIIKHFAERRKPAKRNKNIIPSLSARTEIRYLDNFFTIGERINPASRKKFQEEIIAGNFSTIYKEATDQAREGVTLIDLNLGVEKLLNENHFKDVIIGLDKISSIPISFDIQINKFLEIALKEYAGRPLINSARVTNESLEKKAALLKKYGGMLILLAMGNDIPEKPEERLKLIIDGIEYLEKKGINRNRIIADALVLTLGANKDPNITLKTIELLAKEGITSIIGLSNLSFGMPNRSEINGAFLSQAIYFGLKGTIINSKDDFVMKSMKGSLILKGEKIINSEKKVYENKYIDLLLNGDEVGLNKEIQYLLENGMKPLDISQNILSKTMEEIGTLYAKGEIYLPHLLLASEKVKPIFDMLNSLIKDESKAEKKHKVLLATVEGDIHDIGKNIIATVLRSSGFEVIDIGKDLPAEIIVEKVKQEKPEILGLSAMMTTTVGKVEEVAQLLSKENIKIILIAGGASMTEKLALKFGCHGYAKDASTVVDLCKRLLDKK